MASETASWQLELGGEIVARLTGDEVDFPWTYATLIDAATFDRFRRYFSDEETWPDTPQFDALLAEVQAKGGFVLRNLRTGESFGSVRLHQEGNTVWFRYGELI